MTSKERVMCALHRGQPDRVPFAEQQVEQPVLAALFGDQLADDPSTSPTSWAWMC